jgi:hypothetical protein
MAKAAISAAADLGEMAEQMGITARGLQGLQYAAAQQGVELETLQTGIAKFGGETPEEKYARLAQQIENTRAAQEKMTAAARAGDQAFEAQKANVDAQNKLLEIFKGSSTTPTRGWPTSATSCSKSRTARRPRRSTSPRRSSGSRTSSLQAQINLMDQAPEIQARELAIIKAKQEAEKAGNALTADDIENRRAAIEQNERLKIQQEQLKQAQDLWTEPLKQALRDIQTLGANAFEQLLESGNFSFQSLAQTFTTILKKMAAEFLALATIRPVMSVLVSAIGATGLLPQSAIAGLGYGSSLGGASGVAGSGGGGSLLSGLGLGSFSANCGGILGSIGSLSGVTGFGNLFGSGRRHRCRRLRQCRRSPRAASGGTAWRAATAASVSVERSAPASAFLAVPTSWRPARGSATRSAASRPWSAVRSR